MNVIFKQDFISKVILRVHPLKDPMGVFYYISFLGKEYIGPKYYIERSKGPSIMMTIILKGSGTVGLDGIDYKFEAGDTILLNCMSHHTFYPDSQGMSIYYIHIHLCPLTEAVDNIVRANGPVIKTNFDKTIFGNVVKIYDSVLTGIIDDGYFSKLIYENFLKFVDYIPNLDTVNDEIPRQLSELIKYIRGHYNEPYTLDDAAKMACVTKFYLEKQFKKYFDTTFYQYLSDVRLLKAKQLLINTDDSVEEVAVNVGLKESKALIRLFKKRLNDTPLNYRKRMKQKNKLTM